MPKKDYDYIFKCLIVGDYGVGKNDILQSITQDSLTIQPKNAGIDFGMKYIKIDQKVIKLQIWNTVGQFCSIKADYYDRASGILLIYDITNSKSFDNLAKWLKNIEDNSNQNMEIIILGNR